MKKQHQLHSPNDKKFKTYDNDLNPSYKFSKKEK